MQYKKSPKYLLLYSIRIKFVVLYIYYSFWVQEKLSEEVYNNALESFSRQIFQKQNEDLVTYLRRNVYK